MASPPILTPTGTTGWNKQTWQRTVEAATYELMQFINAIEQGDRPYGQLNIRKHQRVAGTVLAQGADGTGLTPSNIMGTSVTLTPAGNYVMAQWSENEDAQLDLDLDSEAQGNIEAALAESTEQGVLANVQSLTQIMSQAAVDGPMLRQAVGRLMGNTNGMSNPKKRPTIYGIFSHTQYPALGLIPEVNSAELRGDGETPYVNGIWTRGLALVLQLSTVVAVDGNGWHNCVYLPSAFKVAWNRKTKVKFQEYELTHKAIVYNNLGSAVQHDLRGIALRTTASQL